jgi:hypothetical protein
LAKQMDKLINYFVRLDYFAGYQYCSRNYRSKIKVDDPESQYLNLMILKASGISCSIVCFPITRTVES